MICQDELVEESDEANLNGYLSIASFAYCSLHVRSLRYSYAKESSNSRYHPGIEALPLVDT